MAGPILHIDLDAFFASVEERDRPELRGKPLIIGGRPDQRGVVSTCSYAARRYGIHSAMPLSEAYRRCPQGIFLPGDMAKYKRASRQVMNIYERFTPLVEPISIDEAFLDLTGCERLFGAPPTIARRIKATILAEVGISASAGIAHNKFLAKIASDLEKPDGLVWIKPTEIAEKLHPLPIGRLWGVGPKTAAKLAVLNIKRIGDLVDFDEQLLARALGPANAHHLLQLALGLDDRPVMNDTETKSMGHEHTFSDDTSDLERVLAVLLHLAEKVGRRLRQANLKGRTVALKLRYHDFTTLTRHSSLREATDVDSVIFQEAKELLLANYSGQPVRLIGVSLQNLSHQALEQLSFLDDEKGQKKKKRILEAMDAIKNRYGEDSITYAKVKEKEPEWEMND